MEIFVIRDGKQAGPYSEDALRALLNEGTVRTKDMGWRKGLSAWMPLGEVLKSDSEKPPERTEKPGDAGSSGTNGSSRKIDAVTAKQKALLKYLGLDANLECKEAAAVAISDAMENPKLQGRIKKWQEEKLRLHANLFQDEIDFQKANRTSRYLELCETEGAGVVKDVTKAHVQVLVESLDKRFPSWESDPRAAVWDYLFPAIAEHFPKLVLPAAQGRLKMGGQPKVPVVLSGPPAGGIIAYAPPRNMGPLSAAVRGLVFGAVVLGLFFLANHFFHFASFHPPTQFNPVAQPGASKEDGAIRPAQPGGAVAAANPREIPPVTPPGIPPADPAAAPAVPPAPAEPVAVPPIPAPPMAENKPPVVEEKPAPAPAPKPVETPAPVSTTPPVTPATAPAAPRASIKLVHGISVPLPNGAVTLQAGTQLRFLAVEGPNVRVSWNNNVFHVPAVATDVGDATPAPAAPPSIPVVPTTQRAPGIPPVPGIPGVPMAPKKPSDDL